MSKTFNLIVPANNTFLQWLDLTNQMANAYKNVVTTAANNSGDVTAGNGFVSGIFGANTMVVKVGLRGGTVDTAANLTVTSNTSFTGANTWFTSNVFVNSNTATINTNAFTVTGPGSVTAVSVAINSTATNTRMVSSTLYLQGNATIANATSFSNTVAVTGIVTLSNTMNFPQATVGTSSINLPNSSANVVESFSKTSYRGAKYIISITDNVGGKYQITEALLTHDGTDTYLTEYATVRSSANNLAVLSANISVDTVRLWAAPTSANTTYKIIKSMIIV